MAYTGRVKQSWIPQKDRKRVFLSLGLALLIVIAGSWTLFHISPSLWHTRQFKGSFKNYGSLARIALFVVLAYYATVFVLQKRLLDQWPVIKKWMVSLSRISRVLHTPIAVIAISLICLHVIGAFMYGFQLDFNNISGLLALLVLLPVPISGIFRYRRLDRKWHLRLGLLFAGLFLIHAFL